MADREPSLDKRRRLIIRNSSCLMSVWVLLCGLSSKRERQAKTKKIRMTLLFILYITFILFYFLQLCYSVRDIVFKESQKFSH